MNVFTPIFFVYFLHTCLALYANANYRSVVTSTTTAPPKPSIEYGVPHKPESRVLVVKPEEVYGLPHFKVPSVIYGVPTRTFDFDLTDIIGEGSEIVPEKPSETYGVPSTSYGVPVQKVAVPKKQITTYIVPSVRTFDLDYDEESDDDTDEVSKPQAPSTSYGVPVKPQVPATVYGVPVARVALKPKVPVTSYKVPVRKVTVSKRIGQELPAVKVPATTYGVPSKEYGLPSVRVPATVYGLPQLF